jgi:hypothetical protein
MTPWDADSVADALCGAAETMQRLPVAGVRPAAFAGVAAGFAKGAPRPAQTFSATEVDRMDAVLRWPDTLTDQRHRMLVRLRADGLTFRRLGMLLGISHVAARKAHGVACARIARAINLGRLAVPPGLRVPTPQTLSHAA